MPAGSFVIRSSFLFFFALKRVKEGGFRLGDPLPSFRNLSAIFTAIIQSLHPTSRHAELLTGWGNGLPALAGVLEAIFAPRGSSRHVISVRLPTITAQGRLVSLGR